MLTVLRLTLLALFIAAPVGHQEARTDLDSAGRADEAHGSVTVTLRSADDARCASAVPGPPRARTFLSR